MKNLYSILTTLITFLISFNGQSQCDYTINMADTWGDGWNGGTIVVDVDGTATNVTLSGGASGTATVATMDAANVSFTWSAGSFDGEISFDILAPDGALVYSGPAPSAGQFTTDVSNAPGCDPPAPVACTPGFGNYTYMYINNVDLISISNPTGQGLYSDNTGLVANAFLGQTYSISGSYAGGYSMGLKIGFDWNADAQYVSSEVVDMGVISAGGAGIIPLQFLLMQHQVLSGFVL
jgi:hypothetical protein